MSEHVEAGGEPHVGALGARLLRDRAPDALLEGRVPARSSRHGDWEAGREAEAHAPRSVGADDPGEIQPPVHACLPFAPHEASPGEVPDPRVSRLLEDLLRERHLPEEPMGEGVDLVLRQQASSRDIGEGEGRPRHERAVDGAFRIGPPGARRHQCRAADEQPAGGPEGLPDQATHRARRLSPTQARLSMDRAFQLAGG